MAKYRITSPDGQKYDITAPDNATQEQVMEYAKKQFAAQEPEQPKDPNAQLRNPVTGMRSALDATASLASGAVAAPVSGFAGLAGAALPGPQGQGADWQQKTQQALTYQPQTQGGQRIAEVAGAPFQYLAGKSDQAGGAVTDATGSPMLGAATNATLQAAPALVGKALGRARPTVEATIARRKTAYDAKASQGSVKAQTIEAARKEGLVTPPSAVGGSFLTNRLESMGGKAAVGQQAALDNQEVFNKIARREAGLGENDPISEQTLDQARVPMEEPYREIAALSPTASKKLQLLKETRKDAKDSWQQYGRSADPRVLEAAKKFDAKAERIEGLIDDEAAAAGKPDLVQRLREARVQLAKNYTVEKSLNLGDGNVDPRIWGRMLDKGAKLTGGLETAAKFAEAFPQYSRPASRIPTPGVSKSEALASLGLGVAGHAASGGAGTLLAAVPLMSHPIRALALSRLMQPSTGLNPYSPGLGLRAGLNLTDQGITTPAAIIAISEEQRRRLP